MILFWKTSFPNGKNVIFDYDFTIVFFNDMIEYKITIALASVYRIGRNLPK